MSDLIQASLAEIRTRLAGGDVSAEAVAKACLDRIAETEPSIHALITVREQALEEARALDAQGPDASKPLWGVPVTVKDAIVTKGTRTTAGSKILGGFNPFYDAFVVERLKEAGAVIVGKNNMDEFAMGSTTENSSYQTTRNPRDVNRVPGGSSGGSAASVTAGQCFASLGTDTGGSIRLPAGWCGLYGIRSTQGQSDISGIYPRAASLDTVGAMARSARDIDLLLQILADPPLRDTLRASAPIRYLRIGVFPDLVRAKGSPEVIEAYAEAVGRWEEFGECIPVGLPLLDDPAVVDSVGIIRSYEFARDIRKDIEGNPFAGKMHPVPLADYKNGQQAAPEAYHAALLHKQALSRQVDAFFASLQVDFLLLPVAFSTAPSIDAPQEAFTAGRTLVNLFSIAGVPTLVVPGELTAAGMPLGIQLVGPALSERLLLDAGAAYETTYGPFPAPPLVSA